jgi:hypothetical protein
MQAWSTLGAQRVFHVGGYDGKTPPRIILNPAQSLTSNHAPPFFGATLYSYEKSSAPRTPNRPDFEIKNSHLPSSFCLLLFAFRRRYNP